MVDELTQPNVPEDLTKPVEPRELANAVVPVKPPGWLSDGTSHKKGQTRDTKVRPPGW